MSTAASPNRSFEQPVMGAAIQLLLGLLLVAQCSGQSVQLMQLRKHYNGVAAQIDSLARQLEGVPLEALMRGASEQAQMIPAGMRLVLLFWADDEAEVFLNGFRIGQSRLTPVRVEIPPLYLQGQNQLRVHCWDTDRVESGFMAGLYLEEPNGALRPVLVTDEATWRSAGTPVQEIYYIHAVPDIPGAQVVWSDRLFGQIWLEADFDASSLQQAAGRAPAGLGDATAQARAMDTHSIVQQLVELQEELGQVEEQLAQQRRQWPQEVVYRGYVDNQVAYTLGREAPLEAVEQLQAARELHAWAAQLPQARQALVFSARRALKGSSAATLAKDRNETGSGPADRRNQYTAPQERGPAPGQAQGGSAGTGGGGSGQQVWVVAAGARDWGLWALIGGLVIYLVAAIWQNWRLYNGKVWT